MTPKLNTSAVSEYLSLLSTSGAIHCTVPQFPVMAACWSLVLAAAAMCFRGCGWWWWCRGDDEDSIDAVALAFRRLIPKSAILTQYDSSHKRLLLFRSRWSTAVGLLPWR